MDKKLQDFIEASLTNPRHPIFNYAFRSPVLQHYALNVKGCGLLESMTAEEWGKGFPHHVKSLTEVMQLCEEDANEQEQSNAEVETLKTKVAELAAKLSTMSQTDPALLQQAPAAKTAEV